MATRGGFVIPFTGKTLRELWVLLWPLMKSCGEEVAIWL